MYAHDKILARWTSASLDLLSVQNISVPLSATETAPVTRYVQQLLNLGSKAGFESPIAEVTKRIKERAAGCDTARALLAEIKPLCSGDFHAALSESLSAIEAQTGSTVTLDGASDGYKKFAASVAKVAASHKLPVGLLKAGPEGRAALASWVQSAQVADAKSELDVLRAEATALLDK